MRWNVISCFISITTRTLLKHLVFFSDPSDRTFVKSFNLLEMKITKLFFFQCDKIAWRSLGRTKQPGHSSSRLSDFPPCPVDLIKLAIPEKAQIFGFKMHSEKKVIKIKTECCCSHGLLLKHKLRHYYWNVILAV